ncbi:hypothetical protein KFK09_028453 [Dendrobium nobile]|uniref:Uncharacterized protein n=1 Tax=Dendrobium nobile TaxID=94219 RepID=A0A8T3A1Y3_DENNO|nr:hypothetical protein KFK09_028453 [Dendrobium nobile]
MDVLTRHLLEDIPWCMLFIDDIILVDKTRDGVEGESSASQNIGKSSNISVFSGIWEPLGASTVRYLTNKEMPVITLYILLNCDEVEPYLERFIDGLSTSEEGEVQKIVEKEFIDWFKKMMASGEVPSRGLIKNIFNRRTKKSTAGPLRPLRTEGTTLAQPATQPQPTTQPQPATQPLPTHGSGSPQFYSPDPRFPSPDPGQSTPFYPYHTPPPYAGAPPTYQFTPYAPPYYPPPPHQPATTGPSTAAAAEQETDGRMLIAPEAWGSEKYSRRRDQNRQNRASDVGGLGSSLHTGGSVPHTEHRRHLKAMLGREPTPVELHSRTHKRQEDQQWIDERSRKAYEDYTRLRETHAASSEGSSGGSVEYSEYRIWSQVVGGMQHGRVYGLGAQAQAYKGMISSTASSFASSSHDSLQAQQITALQAELEQEKKSQADWQAQLFPAYCTPELRRKGRYNELYRMYRRLHSVGNYQRTFRRYCRQYVPAENIAPQTKPWVVYGELAAFCPPVKIDGRYDGSLPAHMAPEFIGWKSSAPIGFLRRLNIDVYVSNYGVDYDSIIRDNNGNDQNSKPKNRLTASSRKDKRGPKQEERRRREGRREGREGRSSSSTTAGTSPDHRRSLAGPPPEPRRTTAVAFPYHHMRPSPLPNYHRNFAGQPTEPRRTTVETSPDHRRSLAKPPPQPRWTTAEPPPET